MLLESLQILHCNILKKNIYNNLSNGNGIKRSWLRLALFIPLKLVNSLNSYTIYIIISVWHLEKWEEWFCIVYFGRPLINWVWCWCTLRGWIRPRLCLRKDDACLSWSSWASSSLAVSWAHVNTVYQQIAQSAGRVGALML